MSLSSRVADLATRIAQEFKNRPGQLVGTTAQRLAYPSPREGLIWYDTTLGFDVQRVGGVWRALHPITHRYAATVTPTTAWKSVTIALPVALDTARGIIGTIGADGSSASSSMIVGTLHRYVPADAATVDSVLMRYASTPSNFGSSTNVQFYITGYPAVAA